MTKKEKNRNISGDAIYVHVVVFFLQISVKNIADMMIVIYHFRPYNVQMKRVLGESID